MGDHPDGLQDLVTRAHIARRLHLTRARVAGATTSAGFPVPLGRVGPSPVWRWAEVRRWAEGATGHPDGPSEEGMRLAGIRDHFEAESVAVEERALPGIADEKADVIDLAEGEVVHFNFRKSGLPQSHREHRAKKRRNERSNSKIASSLDFLLCVLCDSVVNSEA